MVFEAQRAGFERHELDAYLSPLSEDARIVLGRSEEPGKYDLVLNRKQIEATRRLRFRGDPVRSIRLVHDEVQVDVKGDRAELRVRSTARFDGGFERMREVYRLRKTPKGWKVYENRAWPIQMKVGSQTMTFDTARWKALDDQVRRLGRAGDLQQLATTLFTAYRFREAHQAAQRLTEAQSDYPSAWITRGQIAVFAGDAPDAERAFKKALALDPDAAVPAYAKGL